MSMKRRPRTTTRQEHPVPRATIESRRSFMRQAALGGAGATAAALGAGGVARAAEGDAKPITIPNEFESAKHAPLPAVDFPMTGAQVFARACKEEGVKALFTCPGNYDVVHAIGDTGIPTYSGRHEGALCHAADAFCRATGEIAATSGTEGPGFTNMICARPLRAPGDAGRPRPHPASRGAHGHAGLRRAVCPDLDPMKPAGASARRRRPPCMRPRAGLGAIARFDGGPRDRNKTLFAEDTEQGIQDQQQQPLTEGITWTRPTGAPNTPSAPPSSIARSVAGIARPAARGPNSPRECGPHGAATPCRPRRPLYHAAAGATTDCPGGSPPPDAVASPAKRIRPSLPARGTMTSSTRLATPVSRPTRAGTRAPSATPPTRSAVRRVRSRRRRAPRARVSPT